MMVEDPLGKILGTSKLAWIQVQATLFPDNLICGKGIGIMTTVGLFSKIWEESPNGGKSKQTSAVSRMQGKPQSTFCHS
jgi:hypothetical protein